MPNLVVQFLAVAFWFNSTSLSLSKPRLLGIQYLILLCNNMQMAGQVLGLRAGEIDRKVAHTGMQVAAYTDV